MFDGIDEVLYDPETNTLFIRNTEYDYIVEGDGLTIISRIIYTSPLKDFKEYDRLVYLGVL